MDEESQLEKNVNQENKRSGTPPVDKANNHLSRFKLKLAMMYIEASILYGHRYHPRLHYNP